MFPILRNIKNNEAYKFLGENRFQNLRTGIIGEVSDEMARKVFKFNIQATEIINEYPQIEELIKRLNLRFDNIN